MNTIRYSWDCRICGDHHANTVLTTCTHCGMPAGMSRRDAPADLLERQQARRRTADGQSGMSFALMPARS